MTILGFSFDPLTALVAATMFFGWMFFIIFRRFLNGEFRRHGYEPQIDYQSLQDELDEEFAPLSRARREEVAARLQ